MDLLDALTKNAETYVVSVVDSFKGDETIQFLQRVQQESSEKIYPVMDTETYFPSQKITNFIADSALKVACLPIVSPDVKSIEKVWR